MMQVLTPHARNGRRLCVVCAVAFAWAAIVLAFAPSGALAQSDLLSGASEAPKSKVGNTTVIERAGNAAAAAPGVRLVALLTADGQQIDQGVVWRIYQAAADASAKSKLLSEVRQASPAVNLKPGSYMINAAFGRANLTKKITVAASEPQTVQFVLNAGGFRLNPTVGGKPAAPGTVTYAIYADDRDQFDNRTPVMSGAKPNLIIRLNAGIYRIVSTYGDANARVETDVTVEAGKLTEATVTHAAGRAMFKLVTQSGGEAIPDTAWTVQTATGEIVRESVGALPSHYLAPGNYAVSARSGGQVYAGKFAIKDAETSVVEVVKDSAALVAPALAAPVGAAVDEPAFDIAPSFDIKSR